MLNLNSFPSFYSWELHLTAVIHDSVKAWLSRDSYLADWDLKDANVKVGCGEIQKQQTDTWDTCSVSSTELTGDSAQRTCFGKMRALKVISLKLRTVLNLYRLVCILIWAFALKIQSHFMLDHPEPPILSCCERGHWQAHAQCGRRRVVGWACVYSSAGCCWLLMILGECNVVPASIGTNTAVGIKVSCFALAHIFALIVKGSCLLSYEEINLFVGPNCQGSMASRGLASPLTSK